jgi:cytochrome c-type biogenesis protein
VLALAVTAGMLGAVNPCGFALLPAYLTVLVSAVGRALRCTAALTLGYVAVFGAFGLVLAPLAGWLSPRLPWLTVVFCAGLAVAGALLLAGRSLPLPGLPGRGLRAPRLTGSAGSMVLFGMAYAIASLGCAAGPFLAIVVATLRAGSIGRGLLLFVGYAAGMGLVIGVTAVAVALVRGSAVARLRRAATYAPRLGGAVLVAAGLYVAYYGWYEIRVLGGGAVSDPVVDAALTVQGLLARAVGTGGIPLLAVAALVVAAASAVALGRRRRAGGP